ncbi:MAG: sulfatase [Robiginitomaculum sp.]|nr:MAG: sulfatase [Robiginitomaculum sp.]
MSLMKRILASLLMVFLAPTALRAQTAELADRPNIIVIMADDHGQWAMGAYGLKYIQTPNLDWLAETGVLFKNAMSVAPVCSPARASFYTGKMPSQHGVHDFLGEGKEFDANWLSGEKLLSEWLQDSGYRTALLGKWHATIDSAIVQRGFDRWLSYDVSRTGWQNQYQHQGTVYFSDDGKPMAQTGVQARFLTEQAIQFIDRPDKRPFYISLNFVEPHFPFAGLPERLVSKYRPIAQKVVRAGDSSDLPVRLSGNLVPADHEEQLAQYLAAVSLIDDQVGRLMDALQGRDALKNTIVIYVSDHGLLVGQYGLYGKTNASAPANFYEETIRIPLIFNGPARFMRPRQTRHEMVSLIDLHTTIRDFASGGKQARSDYGPGRSLTPLLQGKRQTNWRRYNYAERGNLRMVTNGHWKLVRQYPQNQRAIPTDTWYDLASPMRERHSTVPPRPALRDRLIGALDQFFKKYETPEHSGRRIWDQPYPNARVKSEMQQDKKKAASETSDKEITK